MALSTRTIRGKIKSVGNIKEITKAMEMVAASKMKKAVNRALAGREYAEKLTELLAAIGAHYPLSSDLLEAGKGERTLLIVVEANKGLCGSFNVTHAKAVVGLVRRLGLESVDFVTVGRYAERVVRRLGGQPIASFVTLPEDIGAEDVWPLGALALAEFRTGRYRRVLFVYNAFISALSYKPTVKQLLPLSAKTAEAVVTEIDHAHHPEPLELTDMETYTFEPAAPVILESVLPRLVEAIVYQGMLESRAAEESARMFAMKNASDNAQGLIDDLTLSYNNARQAGITQEIAEIAAGANALAS